MKKILLSLVAALPLMAGCQENNTKTAYAAEEGSVERVVSGQLAYINLDTLMQNYNMYIDLMAEFEERAKKAEGDILSRGRGLERAAADAQEKFDRGLVTRSEAMQLQEDLQRREQSFYQFRDNLQMELAEENQVMTNKIFHAIDSFIKDYNSDYRFGMIFTTSGGAPILHADPSLDITAEVLRGLNLRYEQERSSN